MTTKKDLENELHQLRQKTLELQGENNKLYDRMKLAGLYTQCLRLLPSYSNKGDIGSIDYDRILSVLEMDDYPEGF